MIKHLKVWLAAKCLIWAFYLIAKSDELGFDIGEDEQIYTSKYMISKL